MNKIKVLVTTTSFQDTPGRHHINLQKQGWEVYFLRGPLEEKQLIPIINNAGGSIKTWGNKDPKNGGKIIAANNKTLSI